MNRSRILRVLLSSLLLVYVACSRQPHPSDAGRAPTAENGYDTKLPFDKPPQTGGITPTSSLVPGERTIPVGTPIEIRLKSLISSTTAHAGDVFEAVLDAPILLQGHVVIPTGTPLTLKVVAMRRWARPKHPAYLQLKLKSLLIQGRAIPVESSSIVSKAGVNTHTEARQVGKELSDHERMSNLGSTGSTKVVRFSAEQKLAFRLTVPFTLAR